MTPRQFALYAWASAISFAGVVTVTGSLGYTINVTASLPRGLWRQTSGAPLISRGQYVTVRPPHSAMLDVLRREGYLKSPLIKPIVAIPGDRVTVAATGLEVNGAALPNTAQLARDGTGHNLPRVEPGNYKVQPGTVWIVSTYNPKSLDSRYFGAVPIAALQHGAVPVLTEDMLP